MPQLDFLIYLYQFGMLIIIFFLLYDLFLNFWFPAFLGSWYMILRRSRLASFMHTLLVKKLNNNSYFMFVKKVIVVFTR